MSTRVAGLKCRWRASISRISLRRSAILVFVGASLCVSASVQAGLFDDEAARQQILDLRKQVDQHNQTTDARLAALEEGVAKLDNSVKNLGLAELVSQVETLGQQISQLRGQIEVQNNQIETTQKRQREFYLDLDSRLRLLEQSAPAGGAGGAGGAGAAAVPPGGAAVPPTATVTTPPAPPNDRSVAASSGARAPALAGLTPPVPAGTAPAGTGAGSDGDDDAKAYDEAYRTFKAANYKAAITQFRAFVAANPNGTLAPNAWYWIAVAQTRLRDYDGALASSDTLLSRYPDSAKQADALLVKATAQTELGRSTAARKTLKQIVAQYPTSDAADKARTRLSQQ